MFSSSRQGIGPLRTIPSRYKGAPASSLGNLLRQTRDIDCDGTLRHHNHRLGDDIRWVTASRALKPLVESFTVGSRVFHERTAAVPDGANALFVSTVDIHGRRYVSGIRIQQKSGKSVSLGYQHPQDEALLVHCNDNLLGIVGFCLAQDQRGIRGLSVMLDKDTLSDWFGEHQGIPKRRLVTSSDGQDLVKFLKGGFDVSIPPKFP